MTTPRPSETAQPIAPRVNEDLIERSRRALAKLGPMLPQPSGYALRRPFADDETEMNAQQRVRVHFRNS